MMPMAKRHKNAQTIGICSSDPRARRSRDLQASDFQLLCAQSDNSLLLKAEVRVDAHGVFLQAELALSTRFRVLVKPLRLEPVEIVAAEVRDHQEDLQYLQKKVAALRRKAKHCHHPSSSWLVLESMSVAHRGECLLWKRPKGYCCPAHDFVVRRDGDAQFKHAGAYQVIASVDHCNDDASPPALALRCDGKTLQTCASVACQHYAKKEEEGEREKVSKNQKKRRHCVTVVLARIVVMNKEQSLSVVFTGPRTTTPGATMSIALAT
ncbi:hypothetical protein FI667_g9050, partial [Globisporangium splendens]